MIPAIAKSSEGIMGEPVTACLGTHNCSVKRTAAQKPGSSAEPQKTIIKEVSAKANSDDGLNRKVQFVLAIEQETYETRKPMYILGPYRLL